MNPEELNELTKSWADNGKKGPGYLVKTRKKVLGRTYHSEPRVNGRVAVYTKKDTLLCNPDTITVIGMLD